MNGRAALGLAAAAPVLAVALGWLTTVLPPMLGYLAWMALSWPALLAIVALSLPREAVVQLLSLQPAGRLITLAAALPAIALGVPALLFLDGITVPSGLLVLLAVVAIAHATLEELVWRGALIPDGAPGPAGLALILYALWHLQVLAASGLIFAGGPLMLPLAAFALGGVWTAARLASGTLGLGVMSHAAITLFALIDLAARNPLPPAI